MIKAKKSKQENPATQTTQLCKKIDKFIKSGQNNPSKKKTATSTHFSGTKVIETAKAVTRKLKQTKTTIALPKPQNNVGNIIKSFENRMRKIFEKAVEDSEGYCKPSEPSITICLSNEGKWYCEIYSYLVNYSEEGGRHHSFYADTFEELVKRVNKAIKKQEDIWLGKEVSNHA